MARNDTIEVPLLDFSHAVVERRSIRFGLRPQHPLLPSCRSVGVHDAVEELRQDSRNSAVAAFTELLGSWKVEEKVRFDECSAGFVVEDELLVAMGEDVF